MVSPPASALRSSAWFVPTMKSEALVPLKPAATAMPVRARKASATRNAVGVRRCMRILSGAGWLFVVGIFVRASAKSGEPGGQLPDPAHVQGFERSLSRDREAPASKRRDGRIG